MCEQKGPEIQENIWGFFFKIPISVQTEPYILIAESIDMKSHIHKGEASTSYAVLLHLAWQSLSNEQIKHKGLLGLHSEFTPS